MLRIFKKSLQTGRVTGGYPAEGNVPLEGFRGLPEWKAEKCSGLTAGEAGCGENGVGCARCAEACPTGAITAGEPGAWTVDARRCIFCGYCVDACPSGALYIGSRYELAERVSAEPATRAFGRSVHIRHLDAGSCNGCDWEMTALTGPVFDVQRLGFDFVASPRHADILMVTGPVTRNLEIAARKTMAATPSPKLVVAVGACACSGGICGKSYASSGGVGNILPVDVYIPGCPPRPQALIDGLLKAVGKK